ncbi:MAG: MtrB/PioB family outer membrane beta-barrel protein [Acidobacteriota bacterium]
MHYETRNTSYSAGLTYKPIEELALNLEYVYSDSDGGLDPFELLQPSDFTIPGIHFLPMTRVSSYSDLDMSQAWLRLGARYTFTDAWWLQARYEYGDYSDKEPYLYDKAGRSHFYSLMVGHSF